MEIRSNQEGVGVIIASQAPIPVTGKHSSKLKYKFKYNLKKKF